MRDKIKLLSHSVVLIINNKNEVLLEERADDGFFDFPGGGKENNESEIETASRELLEETGLTADELIYFKTYTGAITYYKYPNGDEIYGIDSIYLFYKYHGELKPQIEEVKSLKFYPINNLPEKMSKRNKLIIKDYLEYTKKELC